MLDWHFESQDSANAIDSDEPMKALSEPTFPRADFQPSEKSAELNNSLKVKVCRLQWQGVPYGSDCSARHANQRVPYGTFSPWY